jgi:hypothetical protein
MASEVESRSLAKRLRHLSDSAPEYADAYLNESPVQSVRVMEPSGAIFVILSDGRKILVPQPTTDD